MGNIIRQKFTYTGLPVESTDFGNKLVVMSCSNPVSTTQSAHLQVFFPKLATNHPLPDARTKAGVTPNWFYYWRKTSAGLGYSNYYGGNSTIFYGRTVFENGAWIALIYNGAAGGDGQVMGGLEGIDLYAVTVRHEDHHIQDYSSWWPNNYVPSQDSGDGDTIPDSIESTLSHGNPPYPYGHAEWYDSTKYATYADHFGYGPDGWNDSEDHTMHYQDFWEIGSANREDWSKPGKQWS